MQFSLLFMYNIDQRTYLEHIENGKQTQMCLLILSM